MAEGFQQSVSPCDESGENVFTSAADPAARTLRFAINPNVKEPPKEQLELKQNVQSALSAIQRLYPSPADERNFRRYFVQIAGAAQVGLVGNPAYPDVGKQALASTVAELIDQEGERIKHKHLRDLAVKSWQLSVPLVAVYVFTRLMDFPNSWLRDLFERLYLLPLAVSCFAVMLIGCFLGVILSYAARTTTLSLSDLVTPDTDRLRPIVRLLVSATWAVIFGYFLTLKVVVFQVGSLSTEVFGSQPALAFLLGAIFGLSNLTLPGSVMKKIGDLLPGK